MRQPRVWRCSILVPLEVAHMLIELGALLFTPLAVAFTLAAVLLMLSR